jgi:threonine dehydrogenase-like Zn-dependent dehydrogenase
MKAITVEPMKPGSACLEEIPEPDIQNGSVLAQCVAVGVCGTDIEIAEGKYGWAPPGKTRLVLGHESLGRVIDPGPSSGLKKGDLVVGIVRRPDPVPCPNCAVGEWDMCRNGQYTERGIKQIDGYMSERWRIEPEYAIKVDPSLGILGVLLEPMTVVTKAWEHTLAVGQRAFWEPKTMLVTGAGPIGLLGALLGKQHGLDVHVLARTKTGPKPELVRDLGGTYHSCSVSEIGFQPDIIMECTGVGQVITESIAMVGASGVVCLTGVGHGGAVPSIPTANVASAGVLKNIVVIGSVNANKRHWYKAGEALARADRAWLRRLITRCDKPENFMKALDRKSDDIKAIIQFAEV